MTRRPISDEELANLKEELSNMSSTDSYFLGLETSLALLTNVPKTAALANKLSESERESLEEILEYVLPVFQRSLSIAIDHLKESLTEDVNDE